MPSSGASPYLTTQLIEGDDRHPDHPAINALPDPPFTLLPNPDTDPAYYELRFANSGCDQLVRIYIMAFQSSQPDNPTWSDMSIILSPWTPQTRSAASQSFYKSTLGDADTIWVGVWWDDGTYATAQAYFQDHPAGGGHHTVPITVG
jgi:hypothetical protein